MNFRAIIKNYFNTYIDYRLGGLGALFFGILVYIINIDHGVEPALTAALKQAAYTFFLGGSVLKLVEHLALKIKNDYLAIILGSIIPALLTIALVMGIHHLKGTPMPFESTLPVIILAPPSFLVIAWRKRMNNTMAKDQEPN